LHGFGIAFCFAPFVTSGSPEIMLLVIYRLKLGKGRLMGFLQVVVQVLYLF
jgi:hypothetical protein